MSGRPWTVRLAVGLVLLVAATGFGSSTWRLVVAAEHPGAPVLGLAHHLGVLFLLSRLAVAALEVVVALGIRRGSRAARVVQTVLSGLVTVSAAITSIGPAGGAKAGVTGVVTVLVSAAVLVLLWLRTSRPWFRPASVGPARPGL